MSRISIGQEHVIAFHNISETERLELELCVGVFRSFYNVNLKEDKVPDNLREEMVFTTSDHIPNEFYNFINERYDASFEYKPITFLFS